MKESSRRFLYKLMALTAFYCSLIPFFSVAGTLMPNKRIDLFSTAVPFLVLITGFLSGTYLVRDASQPVERLLKSKFVQSVLLFFNKEVSVRDFTIKIAYSTVLLPALLGLAVGSKGGLLHSFYFLFIFILFYLKGIRCSLRALEQFMSRARIIFGAIALAAALILTYFIKGTIYYRSYILISAYLFILLSMLVKNGLLIDLNLIGRQNQGKKVIPKRIRIFNTISVIAVFCLIFVFFNLKGLVVSLLIILRNITAFLIKLFIKLMNYIFPAAGSINNPQGGSPPDSFVGGMNDINPYMNYFFNVLMYFVILYGCYKLIPWVYKAVKKGIGLLKEYLRRLVGQVSADADHETGEYDDEVEIIRLSGSKERNIKHLRTRTRSIDKIKDPVLKAREAYKSVLLFLIGRGVGISKSDTVGEIRQKTNVIKGMAYNMDGISELYQDVRYGNLTPTASEAEAAVQSVKEIIKTKR